MLVFKHECILNTGYIAINRHKSKIKEATTTYKKENGMQNETQPLVELLPFEQFKGALVHLYGT